MFFCFFVISQQLIANFAMPLGNMLPQVKNNTNIYNFRLSQLHCRTFQKTCFLQ